MKAASKRGSKLIRRKAYSSTTLGITIAFIANAIVIVKANNVKAIAIFIIV